MLRMAIVGVGWAGTRQIEAIRELGRKVAVECLVDTDAAHLRAKADEFGIAKTCTTLADALADPDIDAVSICLPHDLHEPAAAAAAGKQILCEKPLAPTVAAATRMLAAAEAAGVALYVAENVVYQPIARTVRAIVAGGDALDEPTCASFTGGFGGRPFGYPRRRAWLTQPAWGGTGTWMLHGIHSIAQVRFIFGEVATVYCANTTPRGSPHRGSRGR